MIRPVARVLLLWRGRLVLAAIPCPLLIALFFPGSPVWSSVLTGLWVTVFLLMFLVYYPLKYHRLRYELVNDSLRVTCGVFYKNVKGITLTNIQHISITATPLQRILRLSSLYVAGAGGTISLYGLPAADAERLCAKLLSRAKEGDAG